MCLFMLVAYGLFFIMLSLLQFHKANKTDEHIQY